MAPRPDRRPGVWLLALSFGLAVGLGWWLILPPWTAPDEPGHFLYTRLLADLGHRPLASDLGPAVEAPLLRSLAESGWWGYLRRPAPAPLPSRLAADPLLAASGVQASDEPPLFYIPPAFVLRRLPTAIAADLAQALHWLRLWPLALHLGAIVAALWLAQRWWPGQAERVLGLGLLVGGLPMVAFIAGSLNNDALALFWGALAFTLLALPGPFSWPRLLLTCFAVGIAPIWVDAGLLYLWPLALARLSWGRPRARPFWLGAAVVGLILLLPNPRWAAGWRRQPAFALTRADGGLAVNPTPGQATHLIQHIAGKQVLALRNRPLELTVIAQGLDLVGLTLAAADGSQTASLACSMLRPCRLGFTPAADAIFLRLEVEAERPSRFQLRLNDESGRNLLFNGDGALSDSVGSPFFAYLERRLPIPAGYFGQALAPAAWDAPAQLRYLLYAGFTWASFWGYFGWLSRPFPWPIYLLLAAATLAAAWGIFRLLFAPLFTASDSASPALLLRNFQFGDPSLADRSDKAQDRPVQGDTTRNFLLGRHAAVRLVSLRRAKKEGDLPLLRLSLFACGLLLAQVWLPMVGQSWQPQGRYLFPGLLPIAILLLLGWEATLPKTWRNLLPLLLIAGLSALNLLAWRIVIG